MISYILMSSDILLNLLLNSFFHVRAEEEVPVHAISLGLCENVEVSLSHAVFRFIEQNSTPVYEMFPMRNMAPERSCFQTAWQ